MRGDADYVQQMVAVRAACGEAEKLGEADGPFIARFIPLRKGACESESESGGEGGRGGI